MKIYAFTWELRVIATAVRVVGRANVAEVLEKAAGSYWDTYTGLVEVNLEGQVQFDLIHALDRAYIVYNNEVHKLQRVDPDQDIAEQANLYYRMSPILGIIHRFMHQVLTD